MKEEYIENLCMQILKFKLDLVITERGGLVTWHAPTWVKLELMQSEEEESMLAILKEKRKELLVLRGLLVLEMIL